MSHIDTLGGFRRMTSPERQDPAVRRTALGCPTWQQPLDAHGPRVSWLNNNPPDQAGALKKARSRGGLNLRGSNSSFRESAKTSIKRPPVHFHAWKEGTPGLAQVLRCRRFQRQSLLCGEGLVALVTIAGFGAYSEIGLIGSHFWRRGGRPKQVRAND